MSKCNQSRGHPVISSEQWRAYDNLPPRIREVLQKAPYSFDVLPFFRALKRGTVEEVRAWAIREILAARDAEIRRTWGPDHPMLRGLER